LQSVVALGPVDTDREILRDRTHHRELKSAG